METENIYRIKIIEKKIALKSPIVFLSSLQVSYISNTQLGNTHLFSCVHVTFVGPSIAVCKEHATYGNRPCFSCFSFIILLIFKSTIQHTLFSRVHATLSVGRLVGCSVSLLVGPLLKARSTRLMAIGLVFFVSHSKSLTIHIHNPLLFSLLTKCLLSVNQLFKYNF